jgi:hypothetical protein
LPLTSAWGLQLLGMLLALITQLYHDEGLHLVAGVSNTDYFHCHRSTCLTLRPIWCVTSSALVFGVACSAASRSPEIQRGVHREPDGEAGGDDPKAGQKPMFAEWVLRFASPLWLCFGPPFLEKLPVVVAWVRLDFQTSVRCDLHPFFTPSPSANPTGRCTFFAQLSQPLGFPLECCGCYPKSVVRPAEPASVAFQWLLADAAFIDSFPVTRRNMNTVKSHRFAPNRCIHAGSSLESLRSASPSVLNIFWCHPGYEVCVCTCCGWCCSPSPLLVFLFRVNINGLMLALQRRL